MRWSAAWICSFVVRIWQKQVFSWRGSNKKGLSVISWRYWIIMRFLICGRDNLLRICNPTIASPGGAAEAKGRTLLSLWSTPLSSSSIVSLVLSWPVYLVTDNSCFWVFSGVLEQISSGSSNSGFRLFLTSIVNITIVMFLSFRTDRSGQTVQTQIRGAVWSGSTLFAIPSASFGCISLRKSHLVQLLGWLQQIFGCPKF